MERSVRTGVPPPRPIHPPKKVQKKSVKQHFRRTKKIPEHIDPTGDEQHRFRCPRYLLMDSNKLYYGLVVDERSILQVPDGPGQA